MAQLPTDLFPAKFPMAKDQFKALVRAEMVKAIRELVQARLAGDVNKVAFAQGAFDGIERVALAVMYSDEVWALRAEANEQVTRELEQVARA